MQQDDRGGVGRAGFAVEDLVAVDSGGPVVHRAQLDLVVALAGDEGEVVLLRDYQNNRPLYPLLHEFLRTSEVPVLAVWGRNDEIFGPAGARAFARDAKDAEVHLINGGHFLLESHLDVVAGYLRGFLGRVLG